MDRQASFSGSWYQGTKNSLENEINECENSPGGANSKRCNIDKDIKILGIISPHAGYKYSGPTATIGFKSLQENTENIKEIIILGPDHRGAGRGVSLYPHGSWTTPLGTLKTSEVMEIFWKQYKWNYPYSNIDVNSHKYEHSLEMQVPMLQYYIKPAPVIAPILITQQTIEVAEELSDFLVEYMEKSSEVVQIVASSDLSHERDYQLLLQNDKLLEEAFLTGDAYEVNKTRLTNSITTCGYGPTTTLLLVGNKLAKRQNKQLIIKMLSRTNSAIVTGRPPGDYTVGYASILVGLR